MPNYHALTSALGFAASNVVVVGGTAGIGAAIGVRFAELGASVLIVGRNQKAGDEVVGQMKKGSTREDAKLEFLRKDLGSVEEIKAAVEDIAVWAGDAGVHYLVQSQGGPASGMVSSPMTVEALTTGFNVQILSHFLIPYLLLSRPEPVLRKGAQICNIARPGEKGRTIDMDDFYYLKATEAGKFKLFPNVFSFVFMLDLLAHEFNIRFPDTHTTHIYPGAVATGIFQHTNLPWWIRVAAPVLLFFAQSAASYANVLVWQIGSDEAKALKRTYWDQYSREVDVDQRVWNDTQLREGVWEKLMHYGGVRA
ncbi:hypothetical protein HGRIS_005194 [Hohenbuehelia grisea]|uniref:NAD(P)-binding protein n=1 Tax=Hohenbuehelia grisea TaxID=104357 RepID=A0ABR3JFV6_9AGAR